MRIQQQEKTVPCCHHKFRRGPHSEHVGLGVCVLRVLRVSVSVHVAIRVRHILRLATHERTNAKCTHTSNASNPTKWNMFVFELVSFAVALEIMLSHQLIVYGTTGRTVLSSH